ncbi:MAG: HPP family protein [Halioglobus sp.]
MFAIYTPQGRTFSGSLENLRRVEKIPETSSAKAALAADADELHRAMSAQQTSYKENAEAAQAYAQNRQKSGQREPVHHAYQAMSNRVTTLQAAWTLRRANQAFEDHAYQVFPVVDEQRVLVGLLSRCDYYRFLLNAGPSLDTSQTTLSECFLTEDSKVYCADPVTDIRRIAKLLVEKELPGIPIVEESGKLVGIVSRTDVLACAVSDPPLSLWA